MKTFEFTLPDSFEGKDLSTCIFNLVLNSNEGTLFVSMIDKSGRFVREIVPVRTKNVPSNEENVNKPE